MTTTHAPDVALLDLGPTPADFRADVLAGLTDPRGKRIPPKYFYDERGSALFDAITELEEYYPTRTERSILEAHAPEMAGHLGRAAVVVEYGSGSSDKTRLLLDALDAPAAYVPIDISCEHLLEAARGIQAAYPALAVLPVCADYVGELELPPLPRHAGLKAGFFPGSTIGNFEPRGALAFLASVADIVGPDGGLLIGTDLKKDRRILEPAYNDAAGVTAAFNLNLLTRMNRELGAGFKVDSFIHRAEYNERDGRMEMFLISLEDQTVEIAGVDVRFGAGERIHTESSYKFDQAQVDEMARRSGFVTAATWTDDRGWFAVHYLRRA